jgi:hypothetical protein
MEIRDVGKWHVITFRPLSSMTHYLPWCHSPCMETGFCAEVASHADRLSSRGFQAFRSEATLGFQVTTAGAHRFEWHKNRCNGRATALLTPASATSPRKRGARGY